MAKKSSRASGIAKGYLHGFTPEEQERLVYQARFLESAVFAGVDFSKQKRIVEVGSGVGAQTEILLERFPHLRIQCLDASQPQVETARRRLKKQIEQGRVAIDQGDAFNLPYRSREFDGAFVCWLLEHVQNPVKILQEIRRVLKPRAPIYCNEVLNATFFLHPYSPATLKYWFEFNDYQWSLKGDPFVGGKLANYLIEAGFKKIETQVRTQHYDNRDPKRRAQFIEYWTSLLLSGAPGLVKAKRVTPSLISRMKRELSLLKKDPDAVIFLAWMHARAQAG